MAELKTRMKEGLRASIEQASAANGVSMNAEIIRRLEWSFREDEIVERLDRIEKLLLSGQGKSA